jgi:uncharacterized protein (DUF433 family)
MARAKGSGSSSRNRVQLDLRPDQVRVLELLQEQLGLRSRSDLIEESISTLLWIVQEHRRGRRVVSIDPSELEKLTHVLEFASRASVLPAHELYDHLIARPHRWRRQLALKGRNMTVGQLVATMRADELSPEDAAAELDLPLNQVREALAYYEVHHDLVDAELREEAQILREKGYAIEPPPLSR